MRTIIVILAALLAFAAYSADQEHRTAAIRIVETSASSYLTQIAADVAKAVNPAPAVVGGSNLTEAPATEAPASPDSQQDGATKRNP